MTEERMERSSSGDIVSTACTFTTTSVDIEWRLDDEGCGVGIKKTSRFSNFEINKC